MPQRTDLAQEAYRLWQRDTNEVTALPGVRAQERVLHGQTVMWVEILDSRGSDALCKPVGRYATLTLDRFFSREPGAFRSTCLAAAELIRELAGDAARGPVLVAGLGNRDMTPDSIGPKAARSVLATRHLSADDTIPKDLFSPVAVLEPGVLGTSGLESAEVVRSVAARLAPRLIIVIDALAAAEPDRLCRTLQVSDSGIVPGSGVGNHRAALDRGTLGVPVLAVGVPTVIDASAFCPNGSESLSGMMVTPRDIDLRAAESARVAAMGINLALHPSLPFEEAELLTR